MLNISTQDFSKSERVYVMSKEKDFTQKTFEEMDENERLKYEVATELGLTDRLLRDGWQSLSASETGRIGGIMNKKIKEGRQK